MSTFVHDLAAAQVRLGLDVSVIALDADAAVHPPLPYAIRGALLDQGTDVLHLHSVFAPRLLRATMIAKAKRIPIISTPHGGLDPAVFQRKRIRKASYGRAVERPRLRASKILTALSMAEARRIEAFVGKPSRVTLLRNPVSVVQPKVSITERAGGVYLGRWDPWQKGLDRLSMVAGALPEIRFSVHCPDVSEPEALRFPNLNVEPAVFGSDKLRAISHAAFLVQLSRWEGFGRALAEAMLLMTPIVISREHGLAPELEAANAAIVVDGDNYLAVAAAISRLVAAPGLHANVVENAHRWAIANCSPAVVAAKSKEIYGQALGG